MRLWVCGREFFIIKRCKYRFVSREFYQQTLSTLRWNFSPLFILFITCHLLMEKQFSFLFLPLQTNIKKWRKMWKSFTKLLICGKRKKRILLIALIHGIPSSFSFSRLIAIKKLFQLFSFLIKIIVATITIVRRSFEFE